MSEYRFSPLGTQIFLNRLGMDQSLIAETTASADRTEILADRGLELHLFVRSVAGRKPSVMLVGVEVKPDPNLSFALRLFNDFKKDIREASPLELVELVGRRFGTELQVGRERDRFFLQRTVAITSLNPREIVKVLGRPTGDLYGITHILPLEGPPPVARCVLVLGLDVDAYEAYLRQWTR